MPVEKFTISGTDLVGNKCENEGLVGGCVGGWV